MQIAPEQLTRLERDRRDLRGLLREALERLCSTFPMTGEYEDHEWSALINSTRRIGADI